MDEVCPRLVVRQGTTQETEYELTLATIILGREPINDVVFANPEVSRRHARLMKRNEQYAIEDLGSTNGTYVNGRRLDTAVILKDGDIIDLGETIRLTYVFPQDTTAPAISSPVSLPKASSVLVTAVPATAKPPENTTLETPATPLPTSPQPFTPPTPSTTTTPSWWVGLLTLLGLIFIAILLIFGLITFF